MKKILSNYKPSAIFWNVLVILAITVPAIFNLQLFYLLQTISSYIVFFYVLGDAFAGDPKKTVKNNFWMNFTFLLMLQKISYLFVRFIFEILAIIGLKTINNGTHRTHRMPN